MSLVRKTATTQCTPELHITVTTPEGPKEYDLVAMMVHPPDHHFYLVKANEKDWFKVDDKAVSKILWDSIRKSMTYKRRIHTLFYLVRGSTHAIDDTDPAAEMEDDDVDNDEADPADEPDTSPHQATPNPHEPREPNPEGGTGQNNPVLDSLDDEESEEDLNDEEIPDQWWVETPLPHQTVDLTASPPRSAERTRRNPGGGPQPTQRRLTLAGDHEEKGYTIVRGELLKNIPAHCLDEVKAMRNTNSLTSHAIFNETGEPKEDSKRREHLFTPKSDSMRTLETVFKEQVLLALTIFGLIITELLILEALRDVTQQCPHCDYNPDSFALGDEHVPHSALLAIQDNTKLVVWEGSHKTVREATFTDDIYRHLPFPGEGTEILLRKGDVIIWRGDLIHAGAQYSLPNHRLFAYAKRKGSASKDMGRKGSIADLPAFPVMWIPTPGVELGLR